MDVLGVFRNRIETHTGKPEVVVEQIADIDIRLKQGESAVLLSEMAQAVEGIGPGIIYWYALNLYTYSPHSTYCP